MPWRIAAAFMSACITLTALARAASPAAAQRAGRNPWKRS